MRVLMPMAESNKIFGFRHGHWITLMLVKKDFAWQAKLYDSKGFMNNFYNRQIIIDHLFEQSIPLTIVSLGHQGILNNKECGYFSLRYILEILKGQDICQLQAQDLRNQFPQTKQLIGFEEKS